MANEDAIVMMVNRRASKAADEAELRAKGKRYYIPAELTDVTNARVTTKRWPLPHRCHRQQRGRNNQQPLHAARGVYKGMRDNLIHYYARCTTPTTT